MKNEKYIAPEMEVVDVKMDAVLMGSCQGADTSAIEEQHENQCLFKDYYPGVK